MLRRPPDAFVDQVRLIEDLGFRYLWLSDLALPAMPDKVLEALAKNESALGERQE